MCTARTSGWVRVNPAERRSTKVPPGPAAMIELRPAWVSTRIGELKGA